MPVARTLRWVPQFSTLGLTVLVLVLERRGGVQYVVAGLILHRILLLELDDVRWVVIRLFPLAGVVPLAGRIPIGRTLLLAPFGLPRERVVREVQSPASSLELVPIVRLLQSPRMDAVPVIRLVIGTTDAVGIDQQSSRKAELPGIRRSQTEASSPSAGSAGRKGASQCSSSSGSIVAGVVVVVVVVIVVVVLERWRRRLGVHPPPSLVFGAPASASRLPVDGVSLGIRVVMKLLVSKDVQRGSGRAVGLCEREGTTGRGGHGVDYYNDDGRKEDEGGARRE
mmetsp:Transcript_40346/g.121561  ORF Transcript_40346/g.121561 Transcript_40346/m.121561 type:complete len:282 (+) Transcript_40346:492-1337(+)